jgi:hypothetical protein
MNLAVQHPRGLFSRQAGRQLSQQPQEFMLLLFHVSSLSVFSIHDVRWGFDFEANPRQTFGGL